MRLLLSIIIACIGVVASAQVADVTYLESSGKNGGTRVFAVTTAVKKVEVETIDGKEKLEPKEQACQKLLNAILFKGVENYNDGAPLVSNSNDAFARSLVNPKTKTFMSYCKEVQQENSSSNKSAYHYIVELNNFNLLRLLKMRGSLK